MGLSADAAIWHHSTFTKNRERLEAADLDAAFLQEVQRLAKRHGLLSNEHFTVDGSLLEAAASLKSFRRKDGGDPPPSDRPRNPTVNFHDERRSNETHASTTDPDARLARKGEGKEARMCHQASVLMENRHGMIDGTDVRPPSGRAEIEAALDLLVDHAPRPGQRNTVGADKGYDTREFVTHARARGFTSQVAQKAKGSAIDARTTAPQATRSVSRNGNWSSRDSGGAKRWDSCANSGRVAAVFALTYAMYNVIRIQTVVATT